MRVFWLAALAIWASPAIAVDDSSPIAFAIHGGAGTIRRTDMSEAKEAEFRQALEQAVSRGYQMLQEGEDAVDAVSAAIVLLEDSPLFNAGKGAVFNFVGDTELDAAVMDGSTLNAGAIAAVTRVRNPILLARAVMESSPHVLLVGRGAESLAAERGLELVDPAYFKTPHRRAQWEKSRASSSSEAHRYDFFSTVGAVALDRSGKLAAGTSTGGMTNKRYGRVGDVPVIGAGTYADSAVCAVSATGHGEYFIRSVVAHDICAIARYRSVPLSDAADEVVMKKLVERGGSGGVIAVDPRGQVSLVFNSEGMYRASIDASGERVVAIFRE